VRYFTGIGVLRADLATPLNPRPDDGPVALYIGIGQAF
jgi:translocation and assembly module TamA